MNETLLNIPNMTNFGNGLLERTVKFNDDGVMKNKKLFDTTIDTVNTLGVLKSKSPYQRWAHN